jgi:hypothetical protein
LHATPGERGVMVAMGHGISVSFWVRGEMTKNKVGPKKVPCYLELIGTRLQGVCNISLCCWFSVGFPLVLLFENCRINFTNKFQFLLNILLVDQNNIFWLL